MVNFGRILEIFPDIFPRDPNSTLYQYVEAHQDEATDFEQTLEEVQNSHFIDHATGEDLDRVGAMFGPLGERAGRNDQEFKIYLKSIVQAYKGAGTVPAIKKAVAAGLGVTKDDVIVEEDYANVRYRIKLKDWSDHKGTTVEELADLADASVATFQRTHYIIDDEELVTGDSISITEGQTINDLLYADDPVGVNPDKTTITDGELADDPVGVNPDKTSVTDTESDADTVGVDPDKTTISDGELDADTVGVNSDKTSVTDGELDGDSVSVSPRKVVWDSGSWDTMRWQ